MSTRTLLRGVLERLNVLFGLRRLIHILGGKIFDRRGHVAAWRHLLRRIDRCRVATRVHQLNRAKRGDDKQHDQSADAMTCAELIESALSSPEEMFVSGHDGLRVKS